MSIFVESLRRLYRDHVISKEKIDSLLETKKLTEDDYDYIMKE